MVENAVHVLTSQQVARSSLLRSQATPSQYADAGSGKLTTAKPVNKPASQVNSEHAKTLAVTLHWANEVASTAAVFFWSGQAVHAPIVPADALYEWTGHGSHGVVALLS